MSANVQTIDSWLAAHSDHQPDRVALRFEGRDHSYKALQDWVVRLAAHLQKTHGIQRGDRIAIYAKNSDITVVTMFAAASLGAIVVPLNWRLNSQELNYVLANCDAQTLIHADGFKADVKAVTAGLEVQVLPEHELRDLPDVIPQPTGADLSDPFLIVYTSGTTGRPKGAVITQEAVFWNAVISVHAHDLTAADHTLNVLPLFHVGGINIQMMPTFFVGGCVTLLSAFDPAAAMKSLSQDAITSTVFVPTVMKALMAQTEWAEAEFPALRMINTGSTDVPVDILRAVHARGISMVQVYGATETGPIATYQRSNESLSTLGSIGRCGAHTRVEVFRADGTVCATDEPGEIRVRGPNNFSHYWKDAQATDAAICDGWFKTGDIAYRDAGRLFWFVGRSKHVIISGGENIYPAELERILNRINGIKDAAVVGVPDPKWGEVPVAAVVVEADGPGEDEILAHFDDQIARFKRPKKIVILPELPKNALGKVVVDDLRDVVLREVSQ